METNQNKTIARAVELINECIKHKVLLEKDNCIAVFFQRGDGKAEWLWMSKLQAARDIVKNDAFETLEKGLKKAKATKVVENCLLSGIFCKSKDNGITHCYVPNGDKIQWENADAAAEDIAGQETWVVDNHAYNIKSIEYLEMLVEIYRDTQANCPVLHKMIFESSDGNILLSDGKDAHNIYYFNPDSNRGGQIVQCALDDEMARRIIDGGEWIEVVAENPHWLADIDTPYFFEAVADLIQSYYDASWIGTFANDDEASELLKTLPSLATSYRDGEGESV